MMGHEPSLVHSGAEAIDMARETAPDAILLDIGLPGMSGMMSAKRCGPTRRSSRH